MKTLMMFAILLSTLFAADGILVLQLKGDSHSIVALNKGLEKAGVQERLPSELELKSSLSQDQMYKIFERLNDLAEKANRNEMIRALAHGEKLNGKTVCFKGDNKKIRKVYETMTSIFISEQFTIKAYSSKDANRVGIFYDESDGGDGGTWLNIRRCGSEE